MLTSSSSKSKFLKSKKSSQVKEELLVKVFLVYQEMRAVGAIPDATCYNTLLRACALTGDVSQSRSLLAQMLGQKTLSNTFGVYSTSGTQSYYSERIITHCMYGWG